MKKILIQKVSPNLKKFYLRNLGYDLRTLKAKEKIRKIKEIKLTENQIKSYFAKKLKIDRRTNFFKNLKLDDILKKQKITFDEAFKEWTSDDFRELGEGFLSMIYNEKFSFEELEFFQKISENLTNEEIGRVLAEGSLKYNIDIRQIIYGEGVSNVKESRAVRESFSDVNTRLERIEVYKKIFLDYQKEKMNKKDYENFEAEVEDGWMYLLDKKANGSL